MSLKLYWCRSPLCPYALAALPGERQRLVDATLREKHRRLDIHCFQGEITLYSTDFTQQPRPAGFGLFGTDHRVEVQRIAHNKPFSLGFLRPTEFDLFFEIPRGAVHSVMQQRIGIDV